MPRSASSPFNFSVPSGTAAVSGQVISSVAYNNFLADLTNNALNAAWPITYGGTGTTDGSVLVPNGSAATPSMRFQSETNSGFYWVSAGDIGISILGTKVADITASGITIANVNGYTTTATAAGTTTLTATSTYQQYFTGSTTQTVVLPVTSTLVLGQSFRIVNNSTGVVTVNSSGANAVVALAAGTAAIVTCILLTGTTAASWSIAYIPVTVNANSTTLTIASQDAGASAAPIIEDYRNSASPAVADVLGQSLHNGQNSTPPSIA